VEQRSASRCRRSAAARFETLVAAAPDAIVVVAPDGRILSVNPQAEALFGGTVDELVGRRGRRPAARPAPRPACRPAGGLRRRHPGPVPWVRGAWTSRHDGSTARLIPVDIGLTPIHGSQGPAVAAFVRDATERRRPRWSGAGSPRPAAPPSGARAQRHRRAGPGRAAVAARRGGDRRGPADRGGDARRRPADHGRPAGRRRPRRARADRWSGPSTPRGPRGPGRRTAAVPPRRRGPGTAGGS
jgi:PAS domain S-box-containing protein